MRKVYVSTLIAALMGVNLIESSARGSLHLNSLRLPRPALTAAQPPPQLAGVQLFFRGQPIDQIVAGTKIKKYSIELTGTRFLPGSSAVVQLLGVCPLSLEPPQTLVTVSEDGSSITAAFPRGASLSPGLLSVKVVGVDTAASNSLTVDVISNPSDLSIDSISPQSGPVGTQVTLTGVGLKQGDPIRFSAVGSSTFEFEGFYSATATALKPVTFAIQSNEILPVCAACTGLPVCDPIAIPPVGPGQYRVSVIDPKGMSNSVLFQVTP